MGGRNILVITALAWLFGVSLAVAQSGAVEVGVFTTKHPYSAVVYNDYLYIADDDALLVYNISLPDVFRLTSHSASKINIVFFFCAQ